MVAILVAAGGLVEAAAGALLLSGNSALGFLVSDFGVHHMSGVFLGLIALSFGTISLVAGFGLYQRQLWAFYLALLLAVVAVLVGVLTNDFWSFTCLRGAATVLLLVRLRDSFPGALSSFLRPGSTEPAGSPEREIGQPE